ncbi:MAG: uroporphyrinogen decarboxylase family protein [Armatimonadota bacterium]
MNSKERFLNALENLDCDKIPCAPLIWGNEYCWKLTNKPIWEIMHGDGNVSIEILKAINESHNIDWVLPAHWSTKQLAEKKYIKEDNENVYFADEKSGDEYIFNKSGHWVRKLGEDYYEETIDNYSSGVEPPQNKNEADEWLLKNFHKTLSAENKKIIPDHTLRNLFPDKFLCAVTFSPFANVVYKLGFEPSMILLYENPKLFSYIIERTTSNIKSSMEYLRQSGYDGGFMCDSFASSDIISPQIYKDVIAPFHKLISDELHNCGMRSIIYNTGNIIPFLDYISQMNYDAILCEERIKGVEIDIFEIRKKLGNKVCILGNFDSYLLLSGDKEKIKMSVENMIKSVGPRSFIMSCGSPICDDTSIETINYWLDCVRNYKY